MFCSKCGISLPDDAIVCYKCVAPTNIHFQNQPKQIQSVEQKPAPQVHKTVVENPRSVIVQNSSNLGSALVLLALLGGIGFYWYQQNKAHEFFDFKITDKGISVSSDGLKSSGKYPASSSKLSSENSLKANTQREMPSDYSIGNNGATCKIVNSSDTVNGHQYCDTQDCDNDESTVTTSISVGTTVDLTGHRVSSSRPNVGSWVEITLPFINPVFVAETKLSCD